MGNLSPFADLIGFFLLAAVVGAGLGLGLSLTLRLPK